MLPTILAKAILNTTASPIVEFARSVCIPDIRSVHENFHVFAPVAMVGYDQDAVLVNVNIAPRNLGVLMRIGLAIEGKIRPRLQVPSSARVVIDRVWTVVAVTVAGMGLVINESVATGAGALVLAGLGLSTY